MNLSVGTFRECKTLFYTYNRYIVKIMSYTEPIDSQ